MMQRHNFSYIPPKKPVRRSQLIGPWGVGAIVPFPNDETLMIAGLDMWEFKSKEEFVIKDERLARRLRVSELRRPPDYRDPRSDRDLCMIKIPAVRFPTWLYCPNCGTMKKVSYFNPSPVYCDGYEWKTGRSCKNSRSRIRMIPERFIVVCPEGHIDDFPVPKWLHAESGKIYDPSSCKMRRSTGGISSSLSGVSYECTCGAKRSLAGVTRMGALNGIYSCHGSKPWLGIVKDIENPCNNDGIRVVQRGGLNVWFADVRSSIYIPIENDYPDDNVSRCVEENLYLFNNCLIDGKVEINMVIVKAIANRYRIDSKLLHDAIERKILGIEDYAAAGDVTEDEYRFTEYSTLIRASGNRNDEFQSINYSIIRYAKELHGYFKSISLVPVLKETRALIGFSRLEPSINSSLCERKNMLSIGKCDWLPAVDNFGEGIFIEFCKDKLFTWANKQEVIQRNSVMEKHYNSMFSRRQYDTSKLNPKYVMLHTFAHLLINQLIFECGYGSSSIRERIYCNQNEETHEMYGILIYTASGDSEGTLGGLVRQGSPGRLENIVIAAIENAKWCSSDPICIESFGQGPDSCNMAACHNCALLPETCCETGNRLLDRGLVIGLNTGYFC